MENDDALNGKCSPCEGGIPTLSNEEVEKYIVKLNGWTVNQDNISIRKQYKFSSYFQMINFVNAIAWMAEKQGHHPNMTLGYKVLELCYTTHAIDGLSKNDFICANEADKLF